MKYPKLVLRGFAKTQVHVRIEQEGISEDGAPIVALEGDFLGNWQDSAEVVLTKEQKKVKLSGRVYFDGDIAPSIAEISCGVVTVFGSDRRIAKGRKHRNPDGTVNFSELQVV